MTESIRDSIYDAIASIRLIDPHTHINPHSPASHTLADLLGYHYYTELAHSAGMPKDQIEEPGLDPRELVWRLVNNLSPIENTAQYRWLIEICRQFFGFEGDRIDQSNWEELYDAAERQMASAEWPQMVLDQSNVEAVFLTNDFDDPLEGFDTDTYIPCLRTDDLVFHLEKPATRQRLASCTEIELDGSLSSLRESLTHRFEHFVEHGARACAISLPPTFEPTLVSDGRASTALDHVLRQGSQADPSHKNALARRVFWTLAELCDEYGLPFDLMIGVNRGVYAEGVYQGQDLYDSRVSLIQYRELFNAFPAVKFPVSVLASVTNQELVSYAWIFPNVITNGHWWYSNTPSFIARDAAARLEAVPQTKQIAYYSDAYKLEFVWPKFDMYRRILAGILADHFVKGCGWSEERAIELGRQVLRDNVDEIFPAPVQAGDGMQSEAGPETWFDPSDASVVGAVAPVVAAAIDMDDDIDQEQDLMDESVGLDLVDVEQEDEDSPQVEVGESVETPVLSLGAAVQDELDSGDETDQQDEDEVEELPALGMDEGEKDNWDGSHPDQPVDEGEMEELAALGLVNSEQDDAERVAEADTEDGEIDELAALGLIDPEQENPVGDAVTDQEEAKSEDELAALGLEVDEHEDLIGEKEADEADEADEVLEESEDELTALGLEDAEGADRSGDDEANVLVDESEDELTALGLGDAGGADDGDAEDVADADLNGEDQADQAVEESENELVALGLQDADDAEGPDWSGDDQADVAFEEDELAALGLGDGEDDDSTDALESEDAPQVAATEVGEVEELPALGMDEGEKDNWEGGQPDQPVDEGELEELAVLGLISSEDDSESSVETDPEEGETDPEGGELEELAALGLIESEQEIQDGSAEADQQDQASEEQLSALGLEVADDDDWSGEEEAEQKEADQDVEESDDEISALGLEDAEEVGWSVDDDTDQENEESGDVLADQEVEESEEPVAFDLGDGEEEEVDWSDESEADQQVGESEQPVAFDFGEVEEEEDVDGDDEAERPVDEAERPDDEAERPVDENQQATLFDLGDSEDYDWEDDEAETDQSADESEGPVAFDLGNSDEDDAGDDLGLDPLPSAEEIQAVGVDDVELSDLTAQRDAPDADAIESEADSEPLNLDDMLGADADDDGTPEIRQFRADESFELGEESLQLQADPLTGELMMPAPSTADDANDEQLVLEEVDESAGGGDDLLADAQETIAFDEGDEADEFTETDDDLGDHDESDESDESDER